MIHVVKDGKELTIPQLAEFINDTMDLQIKPDVPCTKKQAMEHLAALIICKTVSKSLIHLTLLLVHAESHHTLLILMTLVDNGCIVSVDTTEDLITFEQYSVERVPSTTMFNGAIPTC